MSKARFPERWVRAVCVQIIGAPIAKNTWSKYKSICRVEDLRKQMHKGKEPAIPKTNCLWLMCLCHLKAEKYRQWELSQQQKLQRHDVSWEQKKKIMDALNSRHMAGKNAKVDLTDVIKALNSPAPLSDGKTKIEYLDEMLGDCILVGLLGRDVPAWIEKQTGRKLDIRTFQRQAKKHGFKFSLGQPVPTETLDLFLDLYWSVAVH